MSLFLIVYVIIGNSNLFLIAKVCPDPPDQPPQAPGVDFGGTYRMIRRGVSYTGQCVGQNGNVRANTYYYATPPSCSQMTMSTDFHRLATPGLFMGKLHMQVNAGLENQWFNVTVASTLDFTRIDDV